MKSLFVALLLVPCTLVAQEFKKDYKSLYYQAAEKEQTDLQEVILQDWQRETPTDAEYFVAHFNYLIEKSRQNRLALSTEPGRGEQLEISKDDTTVGFLHEEVSFDKPTVLQAVALLSRGIAEHPMRLDMHFGRIYMLGEIEAWDSFTKHIIEVLETGENNKYAWTWTDHQPLADGADFMLDAIQDYIVLLYNTDEDSLLGHIRQIATLANKYHPLHVPTLSNLALVDIMDSQYAAALTRLKVAERLAPNDPIVMANAAQAYERQGDHKKAILYYKKLKAIDPETYGAYADSKTKELKKKK